MQMLVCSQMQSEGCVDTHTVPGSVHSVSSAQVTGELSQLPQPGKSPGERQISSTPVQSLALRHVLSAGPDELLPAPEEDSPPPAEEDPPSVEDAAPTEEAPAVDDDAVTTAEDGWVSEDATTTAEEDTCAELPCGCEEDPCAEALPAAVLDDVTTPLDDPPDELLVVSPVVVGAQAADNRTASKDRRIFKAHSIWMS